MIQHRILVLMSDVGQLFFPPLSPPPLSLLPSQKEKYQTTVSSICTLHSTFDPAASLNPAHSPCSPTHNDGATLPTELGPAHLLRLRRMQQLMTVQLEKTDSVVQRKVARIHCERQELKEERRYCEIRCALFAYRVHVLMRDERRKEERSKQRQTNNKAKQHSTPKAVTFPTCIRHCGCWLPALVCVLVFHLQYLDRVFISLLQG